MICQSLAEEKNDSSEVANTCRPPFGHGPLVFVSLYNDGQHFNSDAYALELWADVFLSVPWNGECNLEPFSSADVCI